MPLPNLTVQYAQPSYWHNASEGFSEKLAAAHLSALTALAATDAEMALLNNLLHGKGKVPNGSFDLSTGAGLSCQIADGDSLVTGRWVGFETVEGYTVQALPINTTSYLYCDDEGEIHISGSELGVSQPENWWYLGWARTNSDSCVETDDTDADVLASTAAVDASVAVLAALIVKLRAAVGEEYMGETPPAKSLHQRILDLIAEGGGGGGGLVYASELEWSVTDARLLGAVITDYLAAHVEQYHAEVPEGDTTVVPDFWDHIAINFGRSVLRATEYTDPDFPGTLEGVWCIVWGVYGDGSGGTPNLVGPGSTWVMP